MKQYRDVNTVYVFGAGDFENEVKVEDAFQMNLPVNVEIQRYHNSMALVKVNHTIIYKTDQFLVGQPLKLVGVDRRDSQQEVPLVFVEGVVHKMAGLDQNPILSVRRFKIYNYPGTSVHNLAVHADYVRGRLLVNGVKLL